MGFWKESWDIVKQSFIDFYEPILHPTRHWKFWIVVVVVTAIAMYLDIKGPLWWSEYWLTGKEIY